MKRTKCLVDILLIIGILLIPLNTFAVESEVSGICGENLTWNLDTEGTLTISGTGPMDDFVKYYYDDTNDYLPGWENRKNEIKKVIVEEGVTSIGELALQYCPNMEAVVLPKSLTRLGDACFYGCPKLTDVELPTSLQFIGRSAFGECDGLISMTIPEGTVLDNQVFYQCANLKTVELPSDETAISAGMFWGCSSLENVTIPQNVKNIYEFAFAECSSLKSVRMYENIDYILDNAFDACGDDLTFIAPAQSYGIAWAYTSGIDYQITDSTGDEAVPVTGIKLSSIALKMDVNEKRGLAVFSEPDDFELSNLNWTSSDGSVAAVNLQGRVTGLKYGTAVITATTKNGGLSASCTVTVEKPDVDVSKVVLNTTTAEMDIGDTLMLEAVVEPENVTDKSIRWVSSNEKVAVVEAGKITALSPGTATISAIAENRKSASCQVTVNAPIIPVSAITLDRASAEIIIGDTLTLTATVQPDNATNKNINWNSENEAVATVSDGVVTAVGQGTADIVATTEDGQKTAVCIITVSIGDPNFIVGSPVDEKISLGAYHSAVIKSDGSLWMWGHNQDCQLGNGQSTVQFIGIEKPFKLMDNVKAVSLGGDQSAALKNDGSLWTWGNNEDGQIGDGTTTIYQREPKKIMDDVIDISVGENHMAAVKNDGSLWLWGNNKYGQIGNGTETNSSVPVKIMDDVIDVELGYQQSAAIKSDGSLWMWGYNGFAQYNNDNRIISTPEKIMNDVTAISLGRSHYAVIKKGGTLWLWGDNYYGQIGIGDIVSVQEIPVKIMDNVINVSLGADFSMALKEDGSLWTWGENYEGELGNGTFSEIDRTNPLPGKVMEQVETINAGDHHAAAVKKDGSLWTWGYNEFGQMGNDTSESSTLPVEIMTANSIIGDKSALPDKPGGFSMGNIDGDKYDSINASDALMALRHSVKEITLEGDAFTRGDVTYDGRIDASDALQILRFSVKEITEFASPTI